MTKLKLILYSFIVLALFFAEGCSGSEKNPSGIKGKFVFDSNRLNFHSRDIFVLKNGRIKLLFKNAYNPVWSRDGRMIACVSPKVNQKKHGICIIDSIGNEKKFIEIPAVYDFAFSLNWSSDDKKIYFVPYPKERSWRSNKVYCYDFLLNICTKVLELDEACDISNLSLSPKGDKLLISGFNNHESFTYLSNNDGTGLKVLEFQLGYKGAWHPDNEHIYYFSYKNRYGERYFKNDWKKIGWGYFCRININTHKVEELCITKSFFNSDLKISRDGNFFYYVNGAPERGRVIYVAFMDKPDVSIQITRPAAQSSTPYSHSQDSSPDWCQD